VPSLCEDLLSSIDQPLKMAKDKKSKRDYLLCDYNRDGDSYRSVQGLEGGMQVGGFIGHPANWLQIVFLHCCCHRLLATAWVLLLR